MGNVDYSELYRRTTAPFAIDMGRISRTQGRIVRPLGAGSIEYVVAGRGTVTENDKTFRVKAGDVFILHAKNYHDYYPDPDDPWTRIWVQVAGPVAPEILRAYNLSNVNHIPDFDLEEYLLDITGKIPVEADPETVNREGPRVLLELVQKIHEELTRRSADRKDPSPEEMIHRRIDDLPDGYITLDQLTEEFHLSKQHMIRIFKARYGITPHEYILNRRLAIAQSLLKRTNLPVKEIAERLHFCGAAYFTEFFHERSGMKPLEYRKKYGQN